MGKIIAVVNQKGGVGKTTTTVNLSAYLADNDRKVLLVDLDPQGNATSGMGIDRDNLEHCIYDALINGVPASSLICPTKVDGLSILPATIQLAGAEVELVSQVSREKKLKRSLDVIKEEYDYILIDCPPSLGLLTVNAFNVADSILIPIQCEYYALEGLSQLTKTYTVVKKSMNKSLTIEGILLTMFDGRTNLSLQVVDEVKSHFKDMVFTTIIPRNVKLSEAPSYGQPISMYDPKSKGAEVYSQLAKEVISHE